MNTLMNCVKVFSILFIYVYVMIKKKLTDAEFLELIINKELELVGAPERYKDLIVNKDKDWYDRYRFESEEQYEEWKQFFFDHFYDWQQKRYSKRFIAHEFGYCNLMWGFGVKDE